MFTDMVGFSALSQRNEALALELLEEHREVLRSLFPKHQGLEIKSTGDGFLVEFASALAAVQCALEIQLLMRRRNESRSAERRVLIRIGIHLGDVVHRENDVFGDGVNIAARIEPLAEPGGICVSRAVYEQIENKVDHALVQMSRPTLKNIQATVEVYRLVIDEARIPRGPSASSPTTLRRKPAARVLIPIAVLSALAVIVVIAVQVFRSRSASGVPARNGSPAGVELETAFGYADVRVLHSFGPTNAEGVNGWGPVALSADGFLYGCAVIRGPGGGGSVYRLRTNGSDYAIVHSFERTRDGAEPTGGVIEGRDGILYGTTFRGGAQDAGTIFCVTKDGTEFRVLHHFAATNDCRYPQSELLEARDGLLYGTATGGGGNGRGGVFRIHRDGTGYSILTGFFRGQPDDPRRPVGGLIQAADGVLYGTTRTGGLKDNGTVFRLELNGAVRVVKSLGLVADGLMQPEGTLLLAGDGFLYGTCTLGGTAGAGGVFRLAPDGSTFAILHHFGTRVDDGRQPSAGLVEAPDGSLLGTTMAGGGAGLGTVFAVRRDGRGIRTLHQFTGGPGAGARSRSRLTPGGSGQFFSATLNGGSGNLGTVFNMAVPVP